MHDFFRLIKRFIPPYKPQVIFNIINNTLSTIFSLFSFAMIIPILQILFKIEKAAVFSYIPFDNSPLSEWPDIIKNNFYYFITYVQDNYGASSSLIFLGFFLIIMTLFKTGFMYMANRNMISIRTGVLRDLRNTIFKKITTLNLGYFSNERKGDILSRMSGDVKEVEISIMSSLDLVFKNLIMIIVYFVTMLIVSWKLTLFVILLLPIAGFLMGKVSKQLKKPSKEGQAKWGELLSVIEETISGLRIIKAFNAEDKIKNIFFEDNEKLRRIMRKIDRRQKLAHPMSEFLGTTIIAIVIWFGGYLILNNSTVIDGAVFIYYLIIFYSIINPAKAFSQAWYNIEKGMASLDRIDEILDANNPIKEPKKPFKIDKFEKEIQFKNINFSYIKEKQVLKNINLTVKKGQTVALVGESGSGKSTMVDLLPRFYDPQSGEIEIDGHNIKDFSLKDLRHIMGNVNQDAILFNDSFYNNITFGVEKATKEEVINAAKIANAHKFITDSENGYDTNIGDGGNKLSGGQRQRISIARAVLKNPPIMILDEATSALDTESEKSVQDALEKLMNNRTTIVIAHRLSTIKNSDIICVMKNGEIIERGTHKELIEKNGAFKHLYEMQSF